MIYVCGFDVLVNYRFRHSSECNVEDALQLAAAGRLRSAVALELVAGKVWALPIAVQPARGIHCRNGTGSP